MSWTTADIPDQTGRTVLVTGANGGLGLETALALAGAGAHVVMAARNQAKAAGARAGILAAHPQASLEVVELDLGSQASVARAAEEVRAAHGRLDVLVLNAGVMASPKVVTEDGFDAQLATNVLGHWSLLCHLAPILVTTPGARVVTLSSIAQHQGRPLDPEDPHQATSYRPWLMYGDTKLAMRHLAVGLQRRFEAAGIDAIAVGAHPGLTNSDLQATTHAAGGAGIQGPIWDALSSWFGMSVPRGALSQLRAATDPAVRGGSYYGPLLGVAGPPVRKPLVRPGSARAVRRLFEVCEQETGLALDLRVRR